MADMNTRAPVSAMNHQQGTPPHTLVFRFSLQFFSLQDLLVSKDSFCKESSCEPAYALGTSVLLEDIVDRLSRSVGSEHPAEAPSQAHLPGIECMVEAARCDRRRRADLVLRRQGLAAFGNVRRLLRSPRVPDSVQSQAHPHRRSHHQRLACIMRKDVAGRV